MASQKSESGASSNSAKPEIPVKIELTASRQHLLAHVAGNVAAGIVVAPSTETTTAAAVAEIAVVVAEEILKKVGL